MSTLKAVSLVQNAERLFVISFRASVAVKVAISAEPIG
jgi:hypothetical protein